MGKTEPSLNSSPLHHFLHPSQGPPVHCSAPRAAALLLQLCPLEGQGTRQEQRESSGQVAPAINCSAQ